MERKAKRQDKLLLKDERTKDRNPYAGRSGMDQKD
jgi:hypothetical protein